MTTTTANSLAKWIGLAVGVSLAAVAVLSWRIPASEATLGADVRLVAAEPGELEISSDGPVASGRALLPGRGAATGELAVRNITGRPARVALKALPSNDELDDAIRLELRSGRRVLLSGELGELREWSGTRLELDPAERATLDVRLWLPRGTDEDFEGRMTDVTLDFRVRPEERAR